MRYIEIPVKTVSRNDGTASWLAKPGPGPFDGPETLALAERCLLGFSAGPPGLPGLYNNFKRMVQTEDQVMGNILRGARILESEYTGPVAGSGEE